MEYKILDRREQLTIITTVEYTYEDGSIRIVDVSHFMPNNENDIIEGINNRGISEYKNKDKWQQDF